MDYGHTPSTSDASGTSSISKMLDIGERQHFEVQNPANQNLNLDNWSPDPKQPLKSLEQTQFNEEMVGLPESERAPIISSDSHEDAHNIDPAKLPLGQVVPLEMPPVTPVAPSPDVNFRAIRTDGDHLSKTAVTEVNQAIEKLAQTGDVSSFYDEARAMTDANLENSFDRKIGEQ